MSSSEADIAAKGAQPADPGLVAGQMVFARQASGLVRQFSTLDVFLWVTTAVASGLMFLPVSTTLAYPGVNFALAFLIGAVIFSVMAVLVAMMTAAMPRAGGLYVVVSRVVNPQIAYMGAIFLCVGWGLAIGFLAFIAVGFVGASLSVIGTSQDVTFLQDVGSNLAGRTGQTWGAVVLVAFWWLVVLLNISWAKRAMRFLTLGALLGTAVALIVFLFHTGGSTASAFNSTWGDGAYQNLLAAADKAGFQEAAFSFSQTIKSLLVVAGAYAGLEAISYAGGEIKAPRRAAMRGWLWGYALSAFVFIAISWAVFHSYGRFISAYEFLGSNDPDAISSILHTNVQPSVPFYAASLIGNAWVGAFLILLLTFWLLHTMLPFFVGSTRAIFAMAMDQALPKQAANIGARTSSPTVATHLMLILSLLGVLAIRNGILYALGIILFCVFFQWPFYGIAAMTLPYSRKDLYELAPVQRRFMGVPVLSIVGAGVFVLALFLLLQAISGMSTSAIMLILAIAGAALIINLWQRSRLESRGLDANLTYAQLPPE